MTTIKQKWIVIDTKNKKILYSPYYDWFGNKILLLDFDKLDLAKTSKQIRKIVLASKSEAESHKTGAIETLKNYIKHVSQDFDRLLDPNDSKFNTMTEEEKNKHREVINKIISEKMKDIKYLESLDVKELTITYTTK